MYLLKVEGHSGAAHHGTAPPDTRESCQHILGHPHQSMHPQLQAYDHLVSTLSQSSCAHACKPWLRLMFVICLR